MQPTRNPKLAPYIVCADPRAVIRFLEAGLGGQLSFMAETPDGSVAHAEVRIADSVVMLGQGSTSRDGFPAMVHMYVDDADAAHGRALAAGATNVRAPTDSPDGDRRGGVRDKWGNEWWFTRAGPNP